MTINLELSHIITLALAFLGAFVGLGKYLLGQLKKEVEGWKHLERELLELRADLPLHYVRREDYVRGQAVIEAKLDSLYNKLDAVALRAMQKGVINEH